MIAVILKERKGGIYVDAKIIKQILEETGSECTILTWRELNLRNITQKIVIEHLTPDIVKFSPKAKMIYIPNLEFLTDWDIKLASKVDIILAKNEQTNVFLKKKFTNVIYSKFTSTCAESKAQKDFNMVAHFAGSSFLKGTDILVKYWLKNDGFLKINPKLILVITFNPLHKKYKDFWKKLNPVKRTTLRGRPLKCEKVHNIYMVKRLNNIDYAYYREKAGFYICPSLMEGFGHYINEGRCNSSVTITTNAPPMNELIRDPRRLIKVSRSMSSFRHMAWVKYLYKGPARANIIDFRDFTDKMEHILSLSTKELKKTALEDYREFVRDRHHFTKIIKKIFLRSPETHQTL